MRTILELLKVLDSNLLMCFDDFGYKGICYSINHLQFMLLMTFSERVELKAYLNLKYPPINSDGYHFEKGNYEIRKGFLENLIKELENSAT